MVSAGLRGPSGSVFCSSQFWKGCIHGAADSSMDKGGPTLVIKLLVADLMHNNNVKHIQKRVSETCFRFTASESQRTAQLVPRIVEGYGVFFIYAKPHKPLLKLRGNLEADCDMPQEPDALRTKVRNPLAC